MVEFTASSKVARLEKKKDWSSGKRSATIEALRCCGKPSMLPKMQTLPARTSFRSINALIETKKHHPLISSITRRIIHHIDLLLSAIERFPLVNPKPLPTEEARESEGTANPDEQLDVTKLLSQIRSRYKVLCSTIGVPAPRLRAMATGEYQLGDTLDLRPTSTRSSKQTSVWDLDNEPPRRQPLEL